MPGGAGSNVFPFSPTRPYSDEPAARASTSTAASSSQNETANLRWIADNPAPPNEDENAKDKERKKREKEDDERRVDRGKRKAEREKREEFEEERRKFQKEKEEWEREKREEGRSSGRRKGEKEKRNQSRSPRRHSRSPRRHSRSPRRHSRSPRRHSRSPRRKNEAYKRLPAFFQECLARSDALRDTSADLLEYVGHSSKAYQLKRKIQNVGQMPRSSKKIDRRAQNSNRSQHQPADRRQQQDIIHQPGAPTTGPTPQPGPSSSMATIPTAVSNQQPAPSASVPAFFTERGPLPSFASLAAVQEPPFIIHPPPSQDTLQGRETERSRSWRRGCEERAASEASDTSEPPSNQIKIYPLPNMVTDPEVAKALQDLELRENDENER